MIKSGLAESAKRCDLYQCLLSSGFRTAGTRWEDFDSKSKTIPGTWCAAGVRYIFLIGSALFQGRTAWNHIGLWSSHLPFVLVLPVTPYEVVLYLLLLMHEIW